MSDRVVWDIQTRVEGKRCISDTTRMNESLTSYTAGYNLSVFSESL